MSKKINKVSKKGTWICVSGLDGSGKTTLIKSLVEFFQEQNITAMHFHQPYCNFVIPLLNFSGQGKPFGDPVTDRLIFALDQRITNYHLVEWLANNEIVISQRGLEDMYVHGLVQGFSYEKIFNLVQPGDLEKPAVIINLDCNPSIAYSRIADDENKDKYEIPSYIIKQHDAEIKVQEDIINHVPFANILSGIPRLYLDTTTLTHDETFQKSIEFLNTLGLIPSV